jgi:hypothetical protein
MQTVINFDDALRAATRCAQRRRAAAPMRRFPSAVRGPVDRPPCSRQRPLRT